MREPPPYGATVRTFIDCLQINLTETKPLFFVNIFLPPVSLQSFTALAHAYVKALVELRGLGLAVPAAGPCFPSAFPSWTSQQKEQ